MCYSISLWVGLNCPGSGKRGGLGPAGWGRRKETTSWRSNAATPGHGSKKNRVGKAFSGPDGLYFRQLLMTPHEAERREAIRKQAATDCEANGRSLQRRKKKRMWRQPPCFHVRAAGGWRLAFPCQDHEAIARLPGRRAAAGAGWFGSLARCGSQGGGYLRPWRRGWLGRRFGQSANVLTG